MILMAGFALLSCDSEDNMIKKPEPEMNLSLNILQNLQTPYQHIFNPSKSTSGRIMDDEIKTSIMEKVKEVFTQAVFVDDIDDEIERGIPVWEVEIELSNGGDIDFYISKDLLEVVKIEGDDDFEGIEVNPGGDFITLSEAVAAAKNTYNGEIEEWELELDNGTSWMYEFEFEDDGAYDDPEVHVDAFSGNVDAVYLDTDDNDDDDDDEDDDSDDDD